MLVKKKYKKNDKKYIFFLIDNKEEHLCKEMDQVLFIEVFISYIYILNIHNSYKGNFISCNTSTIVVTFNYRLGALGFMYIQNNSNIIGNYGIMDQRMLLEWIQKNIHYFGGDKNKVNILFFIILYILCRLHYLVKVLVLFLLGFI